MFCGAISSGCTALRGHRRLRRPTSPDPSLNTGDWASLADDRRSTDAAIGNWAEQVTGSDLEGMLSWHSGAIGREVIRPRWILVVQLFNHGTHHRGQVHGMLTAAGARPDDTDVPFMPAGDYAWPEG